MVVLHSSGIYLRGCLPSEDPACPQERPGTVGPPPIPPPPNGCCGMTPGGLPPAEKRLDGEEGEEGGEAGVWPPVDMNPRAAMAASTLLTSMGSEPPSLCMVRHGQGGGREGGEQGAILEAMQNYWTRPKREI